LPYSFFSIIQLAEHGGGSAYPVIWRLEHSFFSIGRNVNK